MFMDHWSGGEKEVTSCLTQANKMADVFENDDDFLDWAVKRVWGLKKEGGLPEARELEYELEFSTRGEFSDMS